MRAYYTPEILVILSYTEILWMMQIIIELASSIFISYNFFYFFFTYIKITKDTSAKYYQNNKERLQKKLEKDTWESLSNKEKEKKAQYSHEPYKN